MYVCLCELQLAVLLASLPDESDATLNLALFFDFK